MARILALDFGLRRVGAALGDEGLGFATPLETYQRKDERRDREHFRKVVEDYGVARIVVGLPLHTAGGESEVSRAARRWGAWLEGATGVPVVFFDERYTSLLADETLKEAGLRSSQRRGKVDGMAAQILLQHYLDAGCPTVERPGAPIEDPRGRPGGEDAGR